MPVQAVHWFRTHPGTRPMVLLHGFTGSPGSWDAVVRALPDGFTVLAPALPGHHPDMPVARGFVANVERMADTLAAAEHGGAPASPCHLVGYSLGSRLALALALHRPELVSCLTLIGVHPGLHSAELRARRTLDDERWITLLREHAMHAGMHAFCRAWQAQPIFATQERLAGHIREGQDAIRLAHDPEGLAQSLEHMGLGAMPDHGPMLASLVMPLVLVTGALDHKFTALARELAARIPRARHEIIADCGHNPLLEKPNELAALLAGLH